MHGGGFRRRRTKLESNKWMGISNPLFEPRVAPVRTRASSSLCQALAARAFGSLRHMARDSE